LAWSFIDPQGMKKQKQQFDEEKQL